MIDNNNDDDIGRSRLCSIPPVSIKHNNMNRQTIYKSDPFASCTFFPSLFKLFFFTT